MICHFVSARLRSRLNPIKKKKKKRLLLDNLFCVSLKNFWLQIMLQREMKDLSIIKMGFCGWMRLVDNEIHNK